jgi:hypothetical protein
MSFDFHIVIITYNRSEYLRQCVDSVLCQSGVSIFLHIIDNGSTDCTQDVLNLLTQCQPETRLNIHTSSLQTNKDPLDAFFSCVSDYHGRIFTMLGDDDWYSDSSTLSAVKQALLFCNYDSCLLNTQHVRLSSPSLMYTNRSSIHGTLSSADNIIPLTSRQILEKQCQDWKVRVQYNSLPVPSPAAFCSEIPKNYRFHSSASFYRVDSLESLSLSPSSLLTRPFGDIGMIQTLQDNQQHVLLSSKLVFIGVLPIRETSMIQSPFSNPRLTGYLRASLDHHMSINLPIFSIIASNQFLRDCSTLPYVSRVKRSIYFYLSAAKLVIFARMSFLTKSNMLLRLFFSSLTDCFSICI